MKKSLVIALPIACFTVANSSATQGTCPGQNTIPHDDGHYHFSRESWTEPRANGIVFYGRCVQGLPPTEKVRNHWIGVLPKAIARPDRPTIGGNEFIGNNSITRQSPLRYGNSDGVIPEATFIAHEEETIGRPAIENKNGIDKDHLEQLLREGKVILNNNFSFSIEVLDKIESSLSDVDLSFSSEFDGEQLRYYGSYSFKPISSEFDGTQIYIEFGDSLTKIFEESTGQSRIVVQPGEESFVSEIGVIDNEIDFAVHFFKIVDKDNQELATVPVNYLLPGGF